MNFKKIIFISMAAITTIALILFVISFISDKKSVGELKKNAELGLTYIKELKINVNLNDINNIQDEANKLYEKGKNSAAKEKYDTLLDKIIDILKNECEETIDEQKKYANSTTEEQDILDTANKKVTENQYDAAFTFYKSCIEKSRNKLEEYKKLAEELKPEAEEKIIKEAVFGELNKDYRVSDIKLLSNGTWAIATVQPLSIETDDALIALQLLNNKWRIIAGPGTSFEQIDYPSMPKEVVNALNGGL